MGKRNVVSRRGDAPSMNNYTEKEIELKIIRKKRKGSLGSDFCSTECPFFRWQVFNSTKLPVCFLTNPNEGTPMNYVGEYPDHVVCSGTEFCYNLRLFLEDQRSSW